MDVKKVIILSGEHTRTKSFGLERILLHKAFFHGFVRTVRQFLIAADHGLFAAVLGAPYRQRRSPVARAGKIPVLHILKPFAEATGSSGGRFPLDCSVELDEPFACLGSADKPTVERIIENRLVGTPAVRIIVYMLLCAERLPILLEFKTEHDVEVLSR